MLDEILDALNDGEWHGFAEIFDAVSVHCGLKGEAVVMRQLRIALDFLAKYGLVEKHGSTATWRLPQAVRQWLNQLAMVEAELVKAAEERGGYL